MKRKVFLIVLAAVLCFAATASALELTFAQTCWYKLATDVTLYVQIQDGDPLTAAGTLSAGTYVRPTGDTMDGKAGISFNFEAYGYVDGSAIISCSQSVTLPSGTTVSVPEALAKSKSAMNLWLETEYGESLSGGSFTDADGVVHEITDELTAEDLDELTREAKWNKAMGLAYAHNGRTVTYYHDDAGNEIPVLVSYMGLARSRVTMYDEEQMVETWRLSWETEAPEDKVLAVVAPKDAANVRLRATNKSNSTVLNRVPTNTVVQVIKTDKNWTLVDTNDPESPRGYISTSVLQFYPNEQIPYEAAKVSAAGRTTGDDPVWIRSRDSSKARRIIQFNLGEPLSVCSRTETGWCEVDVGGYHAYILPEFVTLDEQLTAENP